MDDFDLLDHYVRTGSHAAFDELVKRHAGWLYASARRRVGSADLADDITQAVFIVLARRARTISRRHSLAAWLHHVGRYAAIDALRRQGARRRHERAAARAEAVPPAMSDWSENAYLPHLDQALDTLPARDRETVVLRFYTGQTLEQIGQAQRVAASTVQRRLERSLARMGIELKRRGTGVSGTTLAAALAATGALVAPPSASAGVTALATAAPALPASATGPIGLANGAMKMMTAIKVKLAAAAAAGAVVVGAGGLVIEQAIAQAQHAVPMTQAPVPAAPPNAVSSTPQPPAGDGQAFDLSKQVTPQWTSAQFNLVHYNPAIRDNNQPPPNDSQALSIGGQLLLRSPDHILGLDRSGARWLGAIDSAGQAITSMSARDGTAPRWYFPLQYDQSFDNAANRFVQKLAAQRFDLNADFKPPVPASLATVNATLRLLTYDHIETIDMPFVPNGNWTEVLPGVRLRFSTARVSGQSYQYQIVSQAPDENGGLPGQLKDGQVAPGRMIAARYLIDAAGQPVNSNLVHPFGSLPGSGANESSSGGTGSGVPPAAMRFEVAVGVKEQELPITLKDVALPALPASAK